MKNVMMTLLFLTGLAATQLSAQTGCTPAPNCTPNPACCLKAEAAAQPVNGQPASTVSCTPEQMKNCTPEQLKACGTAKSGGKVSLVSTAAAVEPKCAEAKSTAKTVAVKEEY